MKVSIVIPSFNHARFIPATLESVLSQDYKDIEVLVFDGGSTDGTLGILESYQGRISYVSRRDHGQADAINQGMGKAKGDILAYLNSDDIYYPGAITTVVKHFETHPACLALYGDAYHLHEDGSIMESYGTEPWSYARLFETCYLCQPAVFWRREIILRHGLFDETLDISLDYEYWLRVGRHVPFEYLRGSYLAGSRMYKDNKTLGNRVRAHQEYLETVLRYADSPPYTWLMHLAHHAVNAGDTAGGRNLEGAHRSAAFVKAIHHYADKYRIPLERHFLDRLKLM